MVVCVGAAPLRAADERVDRLTPEHRTWLEEEVVYIISEREREIFLDIDTLEPRHRFIEAFWKKRDSDRATVENEFQTEHYRRIEYANDMLGRETSIPGWRTDRGRYYILLGEPQSIQPFDGYQEVVSVELWFYQGDTNLALPPFFNLLFFKPRGFGAYRLYRPVTDGPHALLTPTFGLGLEPGPAVDILVGVSHELARASLSFDASESVDFNSARPSLASDVLLARIEELPSRSVRADYLDGFLRYGDRVSSEYSFNFVPNRTVSAVLAGPDASSFVHFAIEIEPQDFSVETNEEQSRYYTTLDLSIEVRDLAEQRLVYAVQRELGIELTPSQFEQVRQAPYSIQDGFPLIPGAYDVSVTLRNRVQKRFTVAEWRVDVAGPLTRPSLGELLLGYETEPAETDPVRGRPFRVGDLRINPATGSVFALHESIHAFVQANGVPSTQAGESPYKVRFSFRRAEELFDSHESVIEPGQAQAIVHAVPLVGMSSGNYTLTTELVDPSGRTISERVAEVQLSPRTVVPRPAFIYRQRFAMTAGAVASAKGEQYWKLGQREEARRELEIAVQSAELQLASAHWLLAALLLGEGQTERAVELLAPLEQNHPNTFEVIAGLGLSHYFQQDYAKALGYLERAITLRPPDPPLLNALGDTYQRLGTLDKARETYERSLGLDPEQVPIQKRLESLATSERAK
jgi:GWxTD domain-containing protein